MKITKQQYQSLVQSRRKQPRRSSHLDRLLRDAKLAGVPEATREHRFHETRGWRFDAAWPERKIAIEYQGGVFHRDPSHSSIGGIVRDYEKFTEASLAGWTLILCTAQTVRSGAALAWLLRAWEGR